MHVLVENLRGFFTPISKIFLVKKGAFIYTRPDSLKTKPLLERTEMKMPRRITRKTLMNSERSENIIQTESINDWVLMGK